MSVLQTRMNRSEALKLARQGKLKGFSMSPRMLEETNVSDSGLEDLILAAGFLLVNELVEPDYATQPEEPTHYDADSTYGGRAESAPAYYESSSSYDSGSGDSGGD